MTYIRRALFVTLALFTGLPAMATGRDLNAELISAAREGRLAMMRALLAEGADVNAANANGKRR